MWQPVSTINSDHLQAGTHGPETHTGTYAFSFRICFKLLCYGLMMNPSLGSKLAVTQIKLFTCELVD
jgi:hypothetical protein